jgi:hypothetical protein
MENEIRKNIMLVKTDNYQPERSVDQRSSFSIIHCQFRKWSAFPAQTPYHYAYNSPLTYRDPSGLAPEKEKEISRIRFEIKDISNNFVSS